MSDRPRGGAPASAPEPRRAEDPGAAELDGLRLVGRHEVAASADMEALGGAFGKVLAAGDVLVLTGPLGAGKTTFTRGLAETLGVRGPVQSPTFVIARTHPSLVGGPALVHVDAYRLGSAAELDDLDLDLARSVVVVEWGREMASAIAEEWWDVEIERPVGADAASVPEDLDADAPRIVTVARIVGPVGP